MNHTRIAAVLCGVWMFAAAIVVLLTLQQGFTLVRLLRLLAFLAPILIVFFFATRSIWPSLVMVTLAAFIELPLPLLDRLSISFVVVAGITVFVMARVAIDKNTRTVFTNPQSVLMFLCALIVILRLLYDRPGSARLGGRGGLGEAVYYVLGVVGYFSLTHLSRESWDLRKNIRWMFYLALGLAVYHLIPRITSEYAYAKLFRRPFWLLLSIILAYTFHRYRKVRMNDLRVWIPYAVVGATLLLCALQPHRRSVLMGLGLTLGIAYMYGKFKRTALIVCMGGGLAIVMLALFFPEGIPWSMKRALSVFIPMTEDQAWILYQERGYSFEVGWASEFRMFMYKLALKRIQSNPLFGTGFGYSLGEILHEFNSVSGKFGSRGIYALAMAGGYHNSVLSLAVFCGIPAMLLFCASATITFFRFMFVMKQYAARAPQYLFVGSVLLGFQLPAVIIMLVNGMAYEFFMVACILGMMNGFSLRIQRELGPSSVSERLSDTNTETPMPSAVVRPGAVM